MQAHWQQRYLQVGYGGVGYTTPEEVYRKNVTVVTLHQGISGVVNGSLVNPCVAANCTPHPP